MRLPKRTLKKIRSLDYRFIWDKRKEVVWDTVTLEKEDDSLGIKDFQMLDNVVAIREAALL